MSSDENVQNLENEESSSRAMLRRDMPRGLPIHVCVIGAGIAGLRATDFLLRRGVDVTIYEARDRVGGRVAQSSHLGHLVDLGPNWIHGTVDNPILELAKKTGTVIHSWSEGQAVFDEDGSKLPDKDVYGTSETFWDIIVDAYRYSHNHSESIPITESLMNFVEKRADDIFSTEPAEIAQRKRRLLLREAEMWGAFVGSSICRQSLKYFWLEECLEGETPFVADTYKKILDAISAPVLSKARVKLKHVVIGINTELHGTKGGSVAVETSNGTKELFDEVIFTPPLGWLKRNKKIFIPPLSDKLNRAIESVGYGNLDKVYITFPSAFWNAPPTIKDISLNSTQPFNTPSTPKLQTLADVDAASNPKHHFPSFTHWFSPAYAQPSNPSSWDQQGLNLAALPGSNAHPTLLFYIYGDCAQHIADLVSSNSASPEATKAAIISFFEPYFSLLPHYSPSDPACVPSGALATAWASDEWAGHGSYCNFQVGLEDGDKAVEIMREGAPERGIWLAGEHTAPFKALGTVTGAWWAGEGAARRICEVYGLEVESGVNRETARTR